MQSLRLRPEALRLIKTASFRRCLPAPFAADAWTARRSSVDGVERAQVMQAFEHTACVALHHQLGDLGLRLGTGSNAHPRDRQRAEPRDRRNVAPFFLRARAGADPPRRTAPHIPRAGAAARFGSRGSDSRPARRECRGSPSACFFGRIAGSEYHPACCITPHYHSAAGSNYSEVPKGKFGFN